MRDFIEFLLKQFVNKPESVVVTESKDAEFTIETIKVAEEDMGVVIGREGKTINSVRNLVRAKAIKDNIMVRVMLEDQNRPATDSALDSKASSDQDA